MHLTVWLMGLSIWKGGGGRRERGGRGRGGEGIRKESGWWGSGEKEEGEGKR